jgi:hypothetical protein
VTSKKRDTGAATERSMLRLLHARYGQKSQNGGVIAPRYICAEHVRTRAGFDCRTMDFLAVDTWESSMRSGSLTIHGVEVKVSRSDWLRELKDPAKSAQTMEWATHRWLAIPYLPIARPEELPEGWGLLVTQGQMETKLVAKVSPVPRHIGPLGPMAVAALLRATVKTAARNQGDGTT